MPMKRAKRSLASKVSALASTAPSSVKKLSRKRWSCRRAFAVASKHPLSRPQFAELASELLALCIDARERLADPLLLLGDLVQCRHSLPFETEYRLIRIDQSTGRLSLRCAQCNRRMPSFSNLSSVNRCFPRQRSTIGLNAEYSLSRITRFGLSNLVLSCGRTTPEDYPERT